MRPSQSTTQVMEMTKEKALEYIDKRMKEIDNDTRYHYPPADIRINAPLAIIQTGLDVEMAVLRTIKTILEED